MGNFPHTKQHAYLIVIQGGALSDITYVSVFSLSVFFVFFLRDTVDLVPKIPLRSCPRTLFTSSDRQPQLCQVVPVRYIASRQSWSPDYRACSIVCQDLLRVKMSSEVCVPAGTGVQARLGREEASCYLAQLCRRCQSEFSIKRTILETCFCRSAFRLV